MLAHHVASIAGILLALALGKSGCETCAVIFGSELTNPLLQGRWFLRQLGRYDGALGDAVDVLFVALFATVRVGLGSVLFYREMAGGAVMYALAWVFMVDIARFAVKKSRAKYKRWAENRRSDRDKTDGCSEKIGEK
ncbi:Transmembrane protein 136 [Merluccius polli]|uniref:Transmembrane protein 136 n=1 Tax=Merluccius polli TaxID=89951 RepID=A0AA47MM13_MERPO|nr:Transmembrane protein 136 [Merluccius polli]